MMPTRRRRLTVLTLASYTLAISTSALFHEHHGCGDEPSTAGIAASRGTDDHDCSVCQFLAQKPAPNAEVAPADISTLVQDIASPAPVCAARGVFTAWRSRAPPALA